MRRPRRRFSRNWIIPVTIASGTLVIVIFAVFASLKTTKATLRYQSEHLRFHLAEVAYNLEMPLSEMYRSVLITSHSLALRRCLIETNQDLIRVPGDELNRKLLERASIWPTLDASSPEVLTVTNTLEAQFLRDVMIYSNGLIDSIIITDVFGAVRVATSKPDRYSHFNEKWWQDTLLVPPGIVYLSDISPSSPTPSVWTWSIPLRTDDGNDSVGIIRFDIRLGKLLERIVTSNRNPEIATHLITQEGLIYPPVSPNYSFPLSSLHDHSLLESEIKANSVDLMIRGLPFHFKSDDGLQGHDWMLIAIEKTVSPLSLENRSFQQIIFLCLCSFGLIVLTALIIGRGSDQPLDQIFHVIQSVNQGHLKSRLQVRGSEGIQNLFVSMNSMLARLTDTVVRYQGQSSRVTREQSLVHEFLVSIREARTLSETTECLLQACIRHIRAESGLVCLFSDETQSLESVSLYSIDVPISKSLVFLVQNLAPTQPILLYAWSHAEGQSIWEEGYQVVWVSPIALPEKIAGYVVLLFKHAPEQNLGADILIDMLCRITALMLHTLPR